MHYEGVISPPPPPPPHSFQFKQSMEERQTLPISARASDIVLAVSKHPVVIVRGNTGCGKTTQVPQFVLDHNIAIGRGTDCNIVVTQVRGVFTMNFTWEEGPTPPFLPHMPFLPL